MYMQLTFLKKIILMPQKDKKATPVRFLQEKRSWKRGGKETKDAADVLNWTG